MKLAILHYGIVLFLVFGTFIYPSLSFFSPCISFTCHMGTYVHGLYQVSAVIGQELEEHKDFVMLRILCLCVIGAQ